MTFFRALYLLLFVFSVGHAEDNLLRWKFADGQSEQYRLTQTAKLNLSLEAGGSVEATVLREFEFRWTVDSVDEDGSAWIHVEVSQVRFLATGPSGQETELDSTSKEEPRGYAATLVPLFRTLMQSKLRARMTTLGEVVELEIPDELAVVLKTKPVGKAIGKLGSEEDLLPLVNLTVPKLPEEAIAVGGRWEAKQSREVVPFGSTTATTAYQLDSVEDRDAEQLASLGATTTIRLIQSDAGEPEATITGQDGEGKLVLNLTSGRVESAKAEEQLELETNGGTEPARGTLVHTLLVERIVDDTSL